MAASYDYSSSSSECEENSEKLDPLSPMFDARRALYAKSIKVPVPSARQFNNIAEFENFLKGKDAETQKRHRKEEKERLPGIVAERAAAQAREAVRKAAIMARNEGPSERTQTQMRKMRMTTVFTRIEGVKGPLSVLRRCMEEKLKAVVVIRAAVSVRSLCKGYVIAFDKHFNMALMDVDETYMRSCKKKLDKTVTGTKEREKHDSLKSAETVDKHMNPQTSRSQESEASLTESVVRDKLSEIFSQCSVKKPELSESDSEMCNISGANTNTGARTKTELGAKTSAGTQSELNAKTSERTKSELSTKTCTRTKSELKAKTSAKTELSAKTKTLSIAGRLSDPVDPEDCPITERTGKVKPPLKKDTVFWDLYKNWAEKRCLTTFEVLERHVNQLFIRGDNVVSVSIAE